MNRFRLLWGLSLVTILVLVTACGGPAPTPETIEVEVTRVVEKEGETVIEEVIITATPVPPEEKIKLVVWDQFMEPNPKIAVDLIYANFVAQHPNVEIQRDIFGGDVMRETLRTAMVAGAGGPDVVYQDVTPARELIDAGLILDLDDYADKYGWKDRIYSTCYGWAHYKGKLWGLCLENEFVGVFYNQDLFDKEGLEVPQTHSEVLEFCREASARGYVPLAHGQNTGWQTYFSFTMPLHNTVGIEYMRKLLFEGQGRWDTDEILYAVNAVNKDMKAAGCFVEDLNALDFNGQIDLFTSEKAFMLPTGTWVVSEIVEFSQDHNVQMMPWFDMETGEPRAYTLGCGSAYYVSADSQHPDEAGMLLDYLFSDEAAKIWIEGASRIPPIPIDASELAIEPLELYVIDTLKAAATGTADIALGWDIDLIVPESFNRMMVDGFPAVYADQKTAEEQVADLQRLWEER